MIPNHLSVFRSSLLPKMVGPYEEVKSMVCASLHVRRLHNKETCNEQGVLTCPLGFILKKKKEKKIKVMEVWILEGHYQNGLASKQSHPFLLL